ncbi:MAG: ABC transporter permease, partial [Bacteroidota bacterium]
VIEEARNNLSPKAAYLDTKARYQTEFEALGLHLPAFYFALGTQAYPDTFRRVVPNSRRRTADCLVARTGNWPATQAYLRSIEATTLAALDLKATYSSDALIEISRLVNLLDKQCNTSDHTRLLRALQAEVSKDSTCQAALAAPILTLEKRFQHLSDNPQKYQHYLPRFSWHGSHNRYHLWVTQVLSGDWGQSKNTGQDVAERIRKAIRWTLIINLSAIFFAYLLSIPLGIYSAVHAGSRFDRRLSVGLFFLFALPSFWVATLASQFLTNSEWLNWFPSIGVGEPAANASWWDVFTLRVHHFFLPTFCLTYGSLAYLTRQVRGAMVEVLNSDYIRTARAKGLPQGRVIWRHAFPNALFPLITLFANILPGAIAGSVIIEKIFNIPGIGKLSFDAITESDWAVVYALLFLAAILTVVGIFLADLLYAQADPRVRLTTKNGSN